MRLMESNSSLQTIAIYEVLCHYIPKYSTYIEGLGGQSHGKAIVSFTD
jgi:exonuclease V gamma subunit